MTDKNSDQWQADLAEALKAACPDGIDRRKWNRSIDDNLEWRGCDWLFGMVEEWGNAMNGPFERAMVEQYRLRLRMQAATSVVDFPDS